MTKLLSLAMLGLTLTLTGCAGKGNTRLIARTSTYIATTVLMEERPDTRPYALDAAEVICATAKKTNASPAVLFDALQDLPHHSPYGAMFFNTLLSDWISYYEAGDPKAPSVLLGTCDGLNLGLMSGIRARSFPHIKVGR